jgi:hypothetical protein
MTIAQPKCRGCANVLRNDYAFNEICMECIYLHRKQLKYKDLQYIAHCLYEIVILDWKLLDNGFDIPPYYNDIIGYNIELTKEKIRIMCYIREIYQDSLLADLPLDMFKLLIDVIKDDTPDLVRFKLQNNLI